jgi:hypothetical protein
MKSIGTLVSVLLLSATAGCGADAVEAPAAPKTESAPVTKAMFGHCINAAGDCYMAFGASECRDGYSYESGVCPD